MTLIARETFFAGDRKITSGDVVDDKDPVVPGREHLFSKAGRGRSDELSPVVHFPPRPHAEPDPEVVAKRRRNSRRRSSDPVDEAPVDDDAGETEGTDEAVDQVEPAADEADVAADPSRPRAVAEDPDDDAPVVE